MSQIVSSLERLTDPAAEPVTMEQDVKNSNIAQSDDDWFIKRDLIRPAREFIENEAQVCLITSAWRESFASLAGRMGRPARVTYITTFSWLSSSPGRAVPASLVGSESGCVSAPLGAF